MAKVLSSVLQLLKQTKNIYIYILNIEKLHINRYDLITILKCFI